VHLALDAFAERKPYAVLVAALAGIPYCTDVSRESADRLTFSVRAFGFDGGMGCCARFPVLIFICVRLARAEEREPMTEFGPVYRDYITGMPAFVPRLGARLTDLVISPNQITGTYKDVTPKDVEAGKLCSVGWTGTLRQ